MIKSPRGEIIYHLVKENLRETIDMRMNSNIESMIETMIATVTKIQHGLKSSIW